MSGERPARRRRRAGACDVLTRRSCSLEVEESADRPGTLLLRLPANRTSGGDLQFVGDGTFEPIRTSPSPSPAAGGRRNRSASSTGTSSPGGCTSTAPPAPRPIDVWAQDASWLMSLDDKVARMVRPDRRRGRRTRSSPAYGFIPAAGNTDDDSPAHTPTRTRCSSAATDLQFLRGLARRNGKLCRVACSRHARRADRLLRQPRTSPRRRPRRRSPPRSTRDEWTVDALEFDWDVMRPTEVDGEPGRPRLKPRRRRRRRTRGAAACAPSTTADYARTSAGLDAAADRAGRRRRARPARRRRAGASRGGSPAAAARRTSTGSGRCCGSGTS